MEDNSLEENYRRFKKNLKKNEFPEYVELDLIEIFDIAGDNNDYYVQTEVLLLGAQLFPYSKELLQRRGFLYANICPELLSEFVNNNPQFDGVCWDLLRIRESGVEGSDAEMMLDKIIGKYKKFEDEDIIRLSELVRELKCEEWLIKNVDILEKKSEYADTVLYEIAMMQHDSGNDEGAVQTLERLTKIDPFRAENWILMAESYMNLGQYEEGLKAIEFARAVETNIPEADAVEASLLMALEKDLPRAIALYEKYIRVNPSVESVIHNLALAYKLVGEPEKSLRLLNSLFLLDPSNSYVLRELIGMSPSNIRELILLYLEHSDEPSELSGIIEECVKEFLFAGDFQSAITLGKALPDFVSKTGIVEYYLWAMMLANDWQGLIDYYGQIRDDDFRNHDLESLFYFAFAFLNSGRLDEAKDVAVKGLEKANSIFNFFDYHLSFAMNQYGCRQALSSIIKLVDYGKQDMIESFDPLGVKTKGKD